MQASAAPGRHGCRKAWRWAVGTALPQGAPRAALPRAMQSAHSACVRPHWGKSMSRRSAKGVRGASPRLLRGLNLAAAYPRALARPRSRRPARPFSRAAAAGVALGTSRGIPKRGEELASARSLAIPAYNGGDDGEAAGSRPTRRAATRSTTTASRWRPRCARGVRRCDQGMHRERTRRRSGLCSRHGGNERR